MPVSKGDKRNNLCSAAYGQSPVRNAPAVIVISSVYEKTTVKYGERGVRYVHMEVGHTAQNIYLQSVSLHIGTVFIGAFDDDKVKNILYMPRNENPLGIMPVGRID
ncbi:MAG: SagB/ThcOx family dehydrogenase [Nitrospirota bacterium]